MNEHVDFVQYFDPKIETPEPANPAQTMADDIEEKWAKAKADDAGRQILTASNINRYAG